MGFAFVLIDILSAGPKHWNFMRVAMLDNFLNRFHPCGGTYPCGRVTPWVGDYMCTSKSGVYIIYYVRGTALGLLAVPTKLGNPGGWEYRRLFLYSHREVKNNCGNFGIDFPVKLHLVLNTIFAKA